ncbi:MAG: DoxX family protein [Bacteriovoracaceae bacterium]
MKGLIFYVPSYPAAANLGLLIFRVYVGLTIAFAHGIGKIPPQEQFVGMVEGMGFPMAYSFAWLAGLAEFAGGIAVALGLLTRFGALGLIVNFAVASLIFHSADPFQVKELAFTFLFCSILLCFTGAGKFSVDALINKK